MNIHLCCSVAVLVGIGNASIADEFAPFSAADSISFVHDHCVACHASDDPEAGLDLESFSSVEQVGDAITQWNKIIDRVASGQMPPEGVELPSTEARDRFVRWIRDTIYHSVCSDGVSPGGPMLRRLNRNEYANTIRDLLGIHVNVAEGLPIDGGGGEGFDNASETLFISPIHGEKYLDAARAALNHALKDPRSRGKLLISQPGDDVGPADAAEQVLGKFLPRAFRRPVQETELQSYVALFNLAYESERSYFSAIRTTLEAVLVSPKFLLIAEVGPLSDEPVLVTDFGTGFPLVVFLMVVNAGRRIDAVGSGRKAAKR